MFHAAAGVPNRDAARRGHNEMRQSMAYTATDLENVVTAIRALMNGTRTVRLTMEKYPKIQRGDPTQ